MLGIPGISKIGTFGRKWQELRLGRAQILFRAKPTPGAFAVADREILLYLRIEFIGDYGES